MTTHQVAEKKLLQLLPDAGGEPLTYQRGNRLVGVLDIGSNSIRLVVYRSDGRLPHPQFNEREICRLGEGVDFTGELAPERMAHALDALRRFGILAASCGLDRFEAFATEAVRRASNSKEFINEAERILGIPVPIISGKDEARLSAYGVANGFLKPKGVVADLGGGSLELITIKEGGKPNEDHAVSLPCGYLVELPAETIEEYLENILWLEKARGQTLYAVGGAWRAMAAAFSLRQKPRIDIVHGLEMSSVQMHQMIDRITASKGDIPEIPDSRRPNMEQAVIITRALLDRLSPDRVVFSASGVREGVLYQRMDIATPSLDPLLDGVKEYGAMTCRFEGFGNSLSALLPPFIEHLDASTRRLALASAYLADIAWLEHPDHRARLALEKMLGLSVVGITHSERIWMAAVLFTRYAGDLSGKKNFFSVLSKKQRAQAKFVGLALRFLMTFSGGITAVLDKISVWSGKKGPVISVAPEIMGSGVLFQRRLAPLAKIYPGEINVES